jgi:hypothetical protein
MNKKFLAIAGLVAMAAFFMIGCQGDRGIQGEPGTTACFGCHDDDNLEFVAIQQQWSNSRHAIGANINRNTVPCARCHTGQGFLNMIGAQDTVAVENPSAIHCFTCHAPHSDGNFGLRVDTPPVLEQGGDFDFGPANLCAHCHQARKPNPPFSDADSLTIRSSRWGAHESMQADIFAGLHAYEFPGEDYDELSPHNQLATNGCIACHMAAPRADDAGGHSTNLTYMGDEEEIDFVVGCNVAGCHDGDLVDFSYGGVQDSVNALLESLRELLLEDSLITEENLVNASSSNPLAVTMDVAGAIYNFRYFEADRSFGVHNPDYYFDALNASIEFMNSRMVLAAH